MRALLLEGVHPDAVARLKADAFDVELFGRALDEAELIEAVRDVEVLGIRSKTRVTPAVSSIAAYCERIAFQSTWCISGS